MELHMVSILKY